MTAIHQHEYGLRRRVSQLRREVFQQNDPAASLGLLDELLHAEDELLAVEKQRIALQEADPTRGRILETLDRASMRGAETTGIEARVFLKLAHIPTSLIHLFEPAVTPLITCSVKATRRLPQSVWRRVLVSSWIEGYSARAVDTLELAIGEEQKISQLPTLFPSRIRDLNELTRATLHILVKDLDGSTEAHQTSSVWLLARTSAPLAITDPQTGREQDLTRYLGAFVTPNVPSLMRFLREAARIHPQGRLVGYQGERSGVITQIKALFEALKTIAGLTYVHSVIDFNPEQGVLSQRVRLPRESLADKEANCIDGTLLFASLMEGISLRPAIVIVPGHALLAWEPWPACGEWQYLETTMIGSHTFEEACTSAERTVKRYHAAGRLRRWPLSELRSTYGITPME